VLVLARRAVATLALLVAQVGTACSPNLSTLQPARTTPEGHLQMTTSADYTHTEGEIRETLDAITDLDISGRMNAAELEQVASAASIALVQPPSIGYQVSAAYGVTKSFELGVRTSMSAIRGHARLQWMREAPGIYGSLAAGVSGYLFGFPIQTFTEGVTVQGFTRFDFDFPLMVGFSSTYFHAWAGPKLVLSTYESDVAICTDARGDTCRATATVHIGGTAAYVTGQLGLAVGYKQFWVAAELTVGRVGMQADVAVSRGGTSRSGAVAHEGLVVSPSVGIIAWF
jgi:hypothetical protein